MVIKLLKGEVFTPPLDPNTEAAEKDAAEVQRLIADPQNLRSWVGRFDPDFEVGEPYMASGCPVSRWLSHMVGREILVEVHHIDVGGCSLTTPPWLRRVIEAIDNDPRVWHLPRRMGAHVSASLLSHLLEEAGTFRNGGTEDLEVS